MFMIKAINLGCSSSALNVYVCIDVCQLWIVIAVHPDLTKDRNEYTAEDQVMKILTVRLPVLSN